MFMWANSVIKNMVERSVIKKVYLFHICYVMPEWKDLCQWMIFSILSKSSKIIIPRRFRRLLQLRKTNPPLINRICPCLLFFLIDSVTYFFFIYVHYSFTQVLFIYLWMFTQDSLFNFNELLSMRVLPSLWNTSKKESYGMSSD